MSDVLLINASYEPMRRITWKRAAKLLVKQKAVIDEAVEGKWITYENGQIPWPKVLRLVNYVKVPYQYGAVTWTKNGVLKRDKGICVFCGKPGANTVEHFNPQSRFPEQARDWENTAAACFKCNNAKGDRTLEEAGITELQYEVKVPYQLRRIRGSHLN